jgi:hypothetical protein
MKKKSMFFALATVLIISTCAFAPSAFAANPTDTSGHWAEGQVLAGINYGYINGYPDGTFKPENTISRAEFVKIVNSARNYTAMTNIPFRDVPVNEWYFQEVQKAYQAGYITGDNEGNFNPSAQITRQEVAVILNRIMPGGDPAYALNGVNDANRIDEWALASVRAVYSRGYITGDADGNFNPLNPLKRGEAVTIMNRVLGVSPLQPGQSLAALSISNINVTDVRTDGATLNITSTRDGNVYWVVLEGENATTPTAEQILGNRTSSNGSPASSGNRAVYANSAITASMTLQSEQSYKVCAVVRDAAANVSAVAIRTFTTGNAGDTGEEWLSNNFTVDNVTNDTVRLTVNSTRAGTLYYVVVEDPNRNVKTPSQSNIRNGRDASNNTAARAGSLNVSSGSQRSDQITGLKGGTNYKIFGCVYESTSTGSLYSTVKSRTFTTTGSNVDWITTYNLTSVTATGATLNIATASGRTGTFYYVVTETQTYPTADQIRNGYDYNNNRSIVYSSTGYSQGINSTSSYPITLYSTGLTAGRTYYVFGVLYTNTNEYSEIERTSFQAGSGTATSLSVSTAAYGVNAITTQASITGFSFNSAKYSASSTVQAAANLIDITFTKSPNSTVTVTSSNTSILTGLTSTTATPFTVRAGLQATGQTVITLTMVESGQTSYYEITIYK